MSGLTEGLVVKEANELIVGDEVYRYDRVSREWVWTLVYAVHVTKVTPKNPKPLVHLGTTQDGRSSPLIYDLERLVIVNPA